VVLYEGQSGTVVTVLFVVTSHECALSHGHGVPLCNTHKVRNRRNCSLSQARFARRGRDRGRERGRDVASEEGLMDAHGRHRHIDSRQSAAGRLMRGVISFRSLVGSVK
jgi:hypothetical protein